LKKIASRAAEPQLAYSTDEDALGTYSPSALDPLVNQFDQSSDPIEYFQKRISIIEELWSSMETNLVHQGEGYQILRRAVTRSLKEYYRSLLTASKFIGGLYHYRDHAGDPNGRSPFAPIPAEKQKQALEFMREHCFSEEAFLLSPELYNKLAPERLPGLDGIDGLFGRATGRHAVARFGAQSPARGAATTTRTRDSGTSSRQRTAFQIDGRPFHDRGYVPSVWKAPFGRNCITLVERS
jgi:hypothetical protein